MSHSDDKKEKLKQDNTQEEDKLDIQEENESDTEEENELNTKAICEQFLEDIKKQENVDIYQLMSVICALHPQNADARCIIPFHIAKTIACFIFQTLILTIMIVQFSTKNIHDKSNVTDIETKIVACSASTYIFFSVYTWWHDIEQQGLYLINLLTFKNCPKYVNKCCLYIGIYANMITLFIAVIGSNMLIYWATDALDVILNCVAIFFMVQIDNEIIGVSDYKNLENWLTKYHKDRKSKLQSKNHAGKQIDDENSNLLSPNQAVQIYSSINNDKHSNNDNKSMNVCNGSCMNTDKNTSNRCYRVLFYFLAVLHILLLVSAFVAPFIITIFPYKV